MTHREIQDQQSNVRSGAGVPLPDDEDLLEAQQPLAEEGSPDAAQTAAPDPIESEEEDDEDEDDADDEADGEEEDGSGGHV